MAKTTKKDSAAKPKKTAKSAAASDKPAKKAKKPAQKRGALVQGTTYAKWGEIEPKWKLIDAEGLTLGRISTHIATLLMGKDDPRYTRHSAPGNFVVVINAEKVKLTGKKWSDKIYHRYTGFSNGIKSLTAEKMKEKHPDWLIEWAVSGMLPKGHVGDKWRKRLRIFTGPEHTHQAQKPEVAKLPNLGGR